MTERERNTTSKSYQGLVQLTGSVAMVRSMPVKAFWISSTLAEVADLPEKFHNRDAKTISKK